MIRSFIQKLGFILLLLLLAATSAHASGKMEVLLGEKVTLQPEDTGVDFSYEWVLTGPEGEILFTQTRPNFEYTFLEGGEYRVTVKAKDRLGEEKTTIIFILVGDLYRTDRLLESGESGDFNDIPLKVVYSTLPALTSQNTIPVIGEGTVLFDVDVSRSDIVEYRIDRNIFKDSDGNGVANDDIDNQADDSYLRGGVWETVYKPGEATKIVPEITVVTRSGETAKAQAEVVFQNPTSRSGDLLAVLQMIPQPRSSNAQVELYDDVQIVGFYARASQGNILEYRIDENIFVDSDRDGNPANDIDNLNHPSFKNGDVWTTTYQKTDAQIIAQLTVVGEGGKGSRIQREVIFTDRPSVDLGPAGQPTEIFISADKTVVLKGNPVLLTVEGLKQRSANYTFDWDLNGDGKRDKLVEGDNTLTHLYEEAGLYKVTVLVTDKDGNQAELTLDVLVKETEKTTANFEYEVNGAQVTFKNLSQAAYGLANQTLRYAWSFGDTDEESFKAQQDQTNVENPVYTYPAKGTYLVTLTVVDADQVSDSKTVEIVIEEGPEGPVVGEESGAEGKGFVSILLKILKWIGIVLLIVLLLVLILLGGILLVIKLQHADLTLEELVDEVKLKILSMLGVEDLIETPPSQDTADLAKDLESDLARRTPDSSGERTRPEGPVQGEVILPSQRPEPKRPEGADENRAKPAAPVSPQQLGKMAGGIDFQAPPGTEGPMPDWLKKAQQSTSTQPPKPVDRSEAKKPDSLKPDESKPQRPPVWNKEDEKDEGDEKDQDEDEGETKGGGGPKVPPSPPKGGAGPVPDWLKAAQSVEKAAPKEEKPAVKAPESKPTPESPKPPQTDEAKKPPMPDWLKSAVPAPSAPKPQSTPGTPSPSVSGESKMPNAAPIPPTSPSGASAQSMRAVQPSPPSPQTHTSQPGALGQQGQQTQTPQQGMASSQTQKTQSTGQPAQPGSAAQKEDGSAGTRPFAPPQPPAGTPTSSTSPAGMPPWLQQASSAAGQSTPARAKPVQPPANQIPPQSPVEPKSISPAPAVDSATPAPVKSPTEKSASSEATSDKPAAPPLPAWLQPTPPTAQDKPVAPQPAPGQPSVSSIAEKPKEEVKPLGQPIQTPAEQSVSASLPAWLQPTPPADQNKPIPPQSSVGSAPKPAVESKPLEKPKEEVKPEQQQPKVQPPNQSQAAPAVPKQTEQPKETKPLEQAKSAPKPPAEPKVEQKKDNEKKKDEMKQKNKGELSEEVKPQPKAEPEKKKTSEPKGGQKKEERKVVTLQKAEVASPQKKSMSSKTSPKKPTESGSKKAPAQQEKPRSPEALMKDFVSKKPESKTRGSAPDQKGPKEIKKADDSAEGTKPKLPAWLQPSSDGSKKPAAAPKVKVPEIKLPEPLPPLDVKKGRGDEKVTAPKNEEKAKDQSATQKPGDAPHVELSMEDLQKGGEFKI